MTTVAHVQDLYDQHRYIDAYALTASLWQPSTDAKSLSVPELILGGRLAARLGGPRLSRWLFRAARERDPENPLVRYYTRHIMTSGWRLLDELREFDRNPDVGGDEVEVRASWFGTYAVLWAALRDFDRAHDCLDRAHALQNDNSWALSCEADVLGREDRWADALKSAERAWALNPGAPYAAEALGISLLGRGRLRESAERLYDAAQRSQSCELVLTACWHQCVLADTLDGEERVAALNRAKVIAGSFFALAPLADRDARRAFARARLEIAAIADDHAGIEQWAGEARSPFHRQVLANIQKNHQGTRIRLRVKRTIQKYQACLPASLSAAMSANGVSISADEMASELTFGGTSCWAAADWLRRRGLHVRFFAATPELASRLIRARIAFVLNWETDEMGHAVAVFGVDERAGTLLVHDPQSFRSLEYLATVLDPKLSPLGFQGMAAVPKDAANCLDALLPPEAAVVESAQEYQKALTLHGPSVARTIVENIVERFPTHGGTRYMQAVQLLEDSHVGEGLTILQSLLQEFPEAPTVRVRFLDACHALGNTARLREVLQHVVERGVLPALQSAQDWIRPADRYVYQYANLLGLSSATRDNGERLIHSLLRRQPASAGAWHNLADLLWPTDREGALLSYRLACCLAPQDEHYASTYAQALGSQQREEEGLRWLESRARSLGGSPHGVGTWRSWISALEDRGYPGRAIDGCEEALALHPDSAELLAFAVPFFARMGLWDKAEERLLRLKGAGHPAAFHEASTHFCQMRGDLDGAVANAEIWIRESPRSIDARRTFLDLQAAREGQSAATRTAAAWMADNAAHEGYEETYCTQLDRERARRSRKYAVLRRRLNRNREDGWGWLELTFECLHDYDIADDVRRSRLQPRIERLLAECDRTASESVATQRVHAFWAERRGCWSEAVTRWIETIAGEPRNFFGYQRAWDCSARLDINGRERIWAEIKPLFLRCPGRLSIARGMMGLLVNRFGVVRAESEIAEWRTERPDDPDVFEAAADLLIEHGHGRSDARRAVDMLLPAVERFPYHSGLRFSLAHAYRRAGDTAESAKVLREFVRRHPNNAEALIFLASIMRREGDAGEEDRILERALASQPHNPVLWEARIVALLETGRLEQASQAVEQSLRRMRDNASWRDRAVPLLLRSGAAEEAVSTAREAVERFPRDALMWLVLGRTLQERPQFATGKEIEACFRRSLRLNAGPTESADRLAYALAEQARFDEAAAVWDSAAARMPDPSPALARQAWLKRVQGRNSDAVSELTTVVTAAPWHHWAWHLLLEWLETDKAWDDARMLLREVPAQMFTDTVFRIKRVALLEKAGVDPSELERDRGDLLRDFPEDVRLHAAIFDEFAQQRRYDKAAAVLDSISEVAPADPFMLARRAAVLAHQRKPDDALEVAARVCFMAAEESPWPADAVWNVAERADIADRLDQILRQRILTGGKPARHAVARMAAYALRMEDRRARQPPDIDRYPGGAAGQLVSLFNVLDSAACDASAYRAELYEKLNDYGFCGVAGDVWRHRNDTRLSTDEWAQVGRALAGGNLRREGRQLLADWRERRGVAMWMVANYAACLVGRSGDRELYATCRDALSGLPHDSTAKFLVHLQAEAAAILDDRAALLEIWHTHSRYFTGNVIADDYFKVTNTYLLADIPRVVHHLQQGEMWAYRRAILRLWFHRRFPPGNAGNRGSLNSMTVWWVFGGAIVLMLRMLESCGRY